MAWHFLKSNSSGVAATEAIDRLLLPLGNSLNSDVHIAVNVYLSWVEEADRQLARFMASRQDVQSLYTEHYWKIRSIDDETVRPFPLIQQEVDSQNVRLQAIRDQLEKYSQLVAMPTSSTVVVLDTNVFMHSRLFTHLPWREITGSSRVLLLVPLVVIDELDDIKDRGGEDARWARRVIKELQAIAPDGKGLGPFRIRENESLQFLDEPREHVRLARPDDEIVRQAEYFSGLTSSPLVVISRDRGMLLRAQSFDVAHLELDPSFDRRDELA